MAAKAPKRKGRQRRKTLAKAKAPKSKVDLRPVRKTLRDVGAKLAPLMRNPSAEITDEHVETAQGVATALQEMVSGLKEAIKRAAMADGKLAPGKTLTAGGRLVYLKLRPGRKESSKNPDDYDLISEPIH